MRTLNFKTKLMIALFIAVNHNKGWFPYDRYNRYQKSWVVVATLISEQFPYKLLSI